MILICKWKVPVQGELAIDGEAALTCKKGVVLHVEIGGKTLLCDRNEGGKDEHIII